MNLYIIKDGYTYTQRKENSIINKLDSNGNIISKYEETPYEIKKEAKEIKEMEIFPEKYFDYYINKNKEIEIRGLTEEYHNITNVKIPTCIERMPVVKINELAFANYIKLKNLEMPDTIEELGHSCFLGCQGLTRVHLSEQIKTIPKWCFHASTIKDINLENIENIEQNAFLNSSIENIKLGKMNLIGDNAFADCHDLKIASIEYVNEIKDSVFSHSENLKELNLPNSLEELPKYMCFDCTRLKKVNIPSEVKTIHTGAFFGCYALDNVILPKTLKVIDDVAFGYCSFKNIELPNGLESIGENAFSSCKLNSIVIPNSVKYIEMGAFQCNENLESVILSNKIDLLQVNVFYNCPNLKTINIPDSVKQIKERAFQNCKNLEVINMSSNTQYDENAFDFAQKLNIKIRDNINTKNIER